jgi:cold shock CspA family protein
VDVVKLTGTVVFVNHRMGYCFVQPDVGSAHFLHKSESDKAGIKPKKGLRLTFTSVEEQNPGAIANYTASEPASADVGGPEARMSVQT